MSRAKGDVAESRAVSFLEDLGYLVVDRNFYSRFGEIDIITTKGEVLHFVEVKSGEEYEDAIINITPSKLQKIIKTANVYMKKNNLDVAFVIDAVVVTPTEIEFLDNITL
jgi:putative endonuclease